MSNMRRSVILVGVLLMSLLGWQANADHCAARDGVMAAKTMNMDSSATMPCHETGGMAGLIEAVPQITWLGKHKGVVFTVAGAVLVASGLWQWHARKLPCPADPAKARACARLRFISWWLWGLAVAFYLIGAFFAFAAKYVLL